jgi:hypothetical protein
MRLSDLAYFCHSAGAQELTGENLKLVWVEFSTLSQAVFAMRVTT